MNDPILIIGAGLSGLAAAQTLHTLGESVLVVEKARGPGGRMSTRREQLGEHAVSFDHGAQFLRGHDPGFRQVMDAWERDRWIAPWRGQFVRIEGETLAAEEGRLRYAPGPGMNRICQEYADRLKDRLQYQTRITKLERRVDASSPPRKMAHRSGYSALPFAPHQDHRPPNFLKAFVPNWPQPPHPLRTRRAWRRWSRFPSVRTWSGVRPVSTSVLWGLWLKTTQDLVINSHWVPHAGSCTLPQIGALSTLKKIPRSLRR